MTVRTTTETAERERQRFERLCADLGVDPMILRAVEAGAPWPIAREAVTSTRLDRDQTFVVQ
jgi:hypothetical protein